MIARETGAEKCKRISHGRALEEVHALLLKLTRACGVMIGLGISG
jgi:hypothetical protein